MISSWAVCIHLSNTTLHENFVKRKLIEARKLGESMGRDISSMYEDHMSGMWKGVPCLIFNGHLYLKLFMDGCGSKNKYQKTCFQKRLDNTLRSY